jgi:cyclopropane fatty-acyl-phospholipid synthase-like methyltransferase
MHKKKIILFRILTNGLSSQNFLGSFFLSFFIFLIPKKYKKKIALNVLSISPHYFIYHNQNSTSDLKREHQRNIICREDICNKLLKPHLNKNMNILDFGCGPGYLTMAASKHCKNILGIDISSGTIACAKILNLAKNCKYLSLTEKNQFYNKNKNIFDLIFSFAVFQHITNDAIKKNLKNFHKILKPDGTIICHIAIDSAKNAFFINKKSQKNIKDTLRKQYKLNTYFRKKEDIIKLIQNSGFKIISIKLIKDIAKINDDIAEQHLFHFIKQ